MISLHHMEHSIPAQIDSLCDLVPNKKRGEKDFRDLLQCLIKSPKECTPFKGKILQHLQAHAHGNPNANLTLLSNCFAKATLLFRKTPNKSEGPLSAWKAGLLEEIVILEKNIDELYKIVGVNSNNIVKLSNNNEDEELESQEKLTEEKADYENIINDLLIRVNSAAHNISALINVQTDFDLPIPVLVLLKLAAKVGLLRWRDYKKKFNGSLRGYVYSLSPYLININLTLFRSIIMVARSNILPFMPFINQNLLRTLEWTRTSNLIKHDEDLFHSLRSSLFRMITFTVEQLSLNINLEPQQLKVLLDSEIVDNLEELVVSPSNNISLKDGHTVEALRCLDNLILVYHEFLEQPLELKVKTYVIQTCVKIYRDFEANAMSATCRKELLHLLQTIANQPYASSTTEIAYHIFELAKKFETDSEMRSMASRSLNIAMAHRPTIVTHYDVYDCYSKPMLVKGANTSESDSVEKMISEFEQVAPENEPIEDEPEESVPEPVEDNNVDSEMSAVESGEQENASPKVQNNSNGEVREEGGKVSQKDSAEDAPTIAEHNSVEKNAVKEPEKHVESEAHVRDEVETYMSYFVERLA